MEQKEIILAKLKIVIYMICTETLSIKLMQTILLQRMNMMSLEDLQEV
jgi:hypothetical protein